MLDMQNQLTMPQYQELKKGNNLTRPSVIELKAAETFISLIDEADMVKFTKNGSCSYCSS